MTVINGTVRARGGGVLVKAIGTSINIYSHHCDVGRTMKNGILVVEFADQLVHQCQAAEAVRGSATRSAPDDDDVVDRVRVLHLRRRFLKSCGSAPSTVDNIVIITGRRRVIAASRTASMTSCPDHAVDPHPTTKMPFFAASPTNITSLNLTINIGIDAGKL